MDVHTNRGKHELVRSYPLQCRYRGVLFGERERFRQELEPLKLDRCHKETVRHESGESLEVERRRVFHDSQLSQCGRLLLV